MCSIGWGTDGNTVGLTAHSAEDAHAWTETDKAGWWERRKKSSLCFQASFGELESKREMKLQQQRDAEKKSFRCWSRYLIEKWVVSSPDSRPVGLSTHAHLNYWFDVVAGQLAALDDTYSNLDTAGIHNYQLIAATAAWD